MQLLEKSINEVGVIESISVTKEGTIISGHARKATFDKQGKKPKEVHLSDNEYPVIVRADIEDNTDLYYKAQILANTTSKQNIDLDTELIEEIAVEYDLDIEELGVEIEEDTETHLEAEEDDFDPTPPEVPITVLGDLYEIGGHRLLCGDSTDSDQVAKLMNGEKADMVFTDPPYDLENEDYHSNIYLFTENAHIFVMHDDKGIINYLRLSNLEFSRFYVANFGFSSPRGNDPYLSHILISQEKNGKAIPHKNMHDGFRSIIPMEYRFRLKDDKTEHKHQKPIKFISTFIEHFSNNNVIILDLFLGSGSTMVASHQLKRKCYGMELDPKYCDVIVRRMLKLDPTLAIKRNGVLTNEFNETK